MKNIIGVFLLLILTGCVNNMNPTDFKDQKPRLIIEEYLSGKVEAWGVLQNRSGKVTRQFKADLEGKWDGKTLILDEVFDWNDGERQTRQWKIRVRLMIIIMRELPRMWSESPKVSHTGQLLNSSMFC